MLINSILNKFTHCLFGLFLIISTNLYADSTLVQKINQALENKCLDAKQTSVNVVELPSGKIVYTYNSTQPLLPASIMKLFTTAAALHYLSPEYRFKTTILFTGKRKGSLILGNLVIRGGGDPILSTEKLWKIASHIKASGIKKITGNLIVDGHFFDKYDRAPEWEVERTQWAYDAKLSPLALNFNTVAIHVQPGSFVGDIVNAWLDPAPPYMNLSNIGKTTKQGRNTVSARRSEDTSGEVKMQVRGRLPISGQKRTIRINVNNPVRYTAETFRTLLTEMGVKIDGSTEIVSTLVNGEKLYENLSEPLSLILKKLNTYSNNFTAEQIIKTIAAERFGTPGSHAEGLKLLKDFLNISKINTQGLVLADGSGLSRNNRMTTQAVTKLLTKMFTRFDIGPDFVAALRIMGANGILSKRLKNSPTRGKVRAKTGTLKKVSTLAGYVESAKREVFGYAIFLNNNRCGHWRADRIEDRIVTAIHKFGSNSTTENSLSKHLIKDK